jgi:hypothetical protein
VTANILKISLCLKSVPDFHNNSEIKDKNMNNKLPSTTDVTSWNITNCVDIRTNDTPVIKRKNKSNANSFLFKVLKTLDNLVAATPIVDAIIPINRYWNH